MKSQSGLRKKRKQKESFARVCLGPDCERIFRTTRRFIRLCLKCRTLVTQIAELTYATNPVTKKK